MRRAAKIDANQNEVVRLLRRIPGVSVAVTSSLGFGFPDLLIGFRGKNYLVELKDGDKTESRRRLTEDETSFMLKWNGQYSVCNSFDEVYKLIMK